ncbi:thiol oxidoreductase [Kriegella sp. EG-1]|nr:thiol oxidoreductase [Flavobacteriaceae bacterium EG-1]
MINLSFSKFLVLILVLVLISCQNDDENYEPLVAEENEELSGGETTSFDFSQNAFGFQAPNLDEENGLFFFTGNSLFNQNWVTAPASTTARDGLGPLFNARSCSGCHFKDGRGRAPEYDDEKSTGLLFRLSVPGTDLYGGNLPDPNYGGQFQDDVIQTVVVEGNIRITYEPLVVTYADGSTVSLQKPDYYFTDLNYGAMASNVQVSPRIANQMIGLGLLDAVPESTILSYADENDSDGDGVSGKPNYVYDIASGTKKLGRFGWKCNQPNLRQQIAGAFSGDLGITSSLFPDENCPPGVDCASLANGGSPEINDENLDKVTLYSATLAVPARRDFDESNILEGKQIFERINCIACHIPKMQTGSYNIPALENQTIRPYTDLLLHDMGEGLADHTPDFDATGTEWRTPPLWGIGLIETVNGHTNLLHDGRARNVEEAILWHGGEATNSKEAFMELSSNDRIKLIDFINSL